MTNAKTLSSAAIADHGFGMLLALTRKLNHFIAVRPNEEWQRGNFNLEELEGKTALIIGTGGIGSHVARRAKAFGMSTIGVDPKEFPPRQSFDRMVYPTGSTMSSPRPTWSSFACRIPKKAKACSAPAGSRS